MTTSVIDIEVAPARAALREVALPPGLPARPICPRRDRLPNFVSLRGDAGEVLAGLKVAFVGTGSVGLRMALAAARLQVGGILLIDPGRLKAQSVLTHPIMPDAALRSAGKAEYAGLACKTLSPQTDVFVWPDRVQSLDPAALAWADVVLLSTDNLRAEVAAAQLCLHLRTPLLTAAVHGETLVSQIQVFRNADGDGACPACSFGQAELRHLNSETPFSCEGMLAGRPDQPISRQPTVCVSFICSTAADLAMVQLLRLVLGLNAPSEDFALQYCGFTNKIETSPLGGRSGRCLCDHDTVWRPTLAPRPVAACSLRELASRAGYAAAEDLAGVSFTVDDLFFVEVGGCECDGCQPVRRFLPAGGPAGRCATCGGPVYPVRFFSHRPVSAEVVRDALDEPLGRIGASSARSVLVDGPRGAVLFHDGLGRQEAGE